MSRRRIAIVPAVLAIAAAAAYVSMRRDDVRDPNRSADPAAEDDPRSGIDDGRLAAPGGADPVDAAPDAEPESVPGQWTTRELASILASPKDDPDHSLSIVVYDREGRAAVAVPVRVEPVGGDPIVGATDVRGMFRFANLPGIATVRISAKDLFPIVVHDVGPGQLRAFLVALVHVVVRVVEDDTENPIDGARVRSLNPGESFRSSHPYFDERTKANGWLTIDAPDNGWLRVLVVPPDGRKLVATVGGGRPTIIAVPSGGRIEGRVRDWNGKPVLGAKVVVSVPAPTPVNGIPGAGGRHRFLRGESSDADGWFLVAGIEKGVGYSIRAEGSGGAGSQTIDGVKLDRTGVARVNLVLLAPGLIEIALVDEAGLAIRGAKITIDGSPYSSVIEPKSDLGPYRVEGLTPGKHRVHVETSLGAPQDFTIDTVSGVNRLPVTVDAGIRIDGFAVDKKGLAVDRALVTIERIGTDAKSEFRTMRTGVSGEFAFGSLSAGRWRISASAPGSATVEVTEVDAPKRGVKLTLATLGRARIQLLREAGGPVQGDVETRRTRADGDVIHGSGTLKDGFVTFEGFDGQPETLEITVEGYSPVSKEVRVPPEGETDLGVVVMRAGHHVQGVVVGANGVGIQGAFVLVGHLGRVVSDRNGKFDFPGVPAGPLSILVVSEFHLKKSVDVSAKAADSLRIDLVSGAHVEGTVVGSDGQGVGGLPLSFVPIDGEKAGEIAERLRTDEDGSFDVRIPPGRYRIEAQDDGDKAALLLADVTLTDGEERKPTLVYRTK